MISQLLESLGFLPNQIKLGLSNPTCVAPADDISSGAVVFLRNKGLEGVEDAIQRGAEIIFSDEPDSLEIVAPSRVTIAVNENPRMAFILFLKAAREMGLNLCLSRPWVDLGIAKSAIIAASATLEGRITIGEDSQVMAGAVLLGDIRIGNGVTIGPNAVIGHTGFGFERGLEGEPIPFPHLGGVIIEDGVSVGANACIDRGSLRETVLRRNAQIDNLVHIAHNVEVGSNTYIIAGAVICGSVFIEENVWIAPLAVVREGLRIGRGSVVGLGAVVTKDVCAGQTVIGNPASVMI